MPFAEIYRGHDKHKARPTRGVKGTLCPEWTHNTDIAGLGTDMTMHNWTVTRAQALLEQSVTDITSRRRYTTGGGVAFEIRPTANHTFHGYPLPWDKVPAWLQNYWRRSGRVTKMQIRQYSEVETDRWAMSSTDDQ